MDLEVDEVEQGELQAYEQAEQRYEEAQEVSAAGTAGGHTSRSEPF